MVRVLQGGLGQILLAPERYHHDAPGVEWPAISARMFVSNHEVGAGDAEDALGHPLIAVRHLCMGVHGVVRCPHGNSPCGVWRRRRGWPTT